MSDIMVSIVIPMYKASSFIVECVGALCRQTLKETEIILVDDCSPDDTYEKCVNAFRDDNRVTVIRQEKNGGPGKARNTGIKRAKGKYIAFVDADDSYVLTALEEMAAAAEKFNADVLHVSGAFVTFTKNMPMDLTTLPDDELVKMQLDREVFDSPTLITNDMKQRLDNWLAHFYHWNVWSKLFRREFLLEHEIFFKDLSLSEDKNFCLNCLLHADKYVKMKGFYYIYRNEIESLSRGRVTPAFLAKTLRTLFRISECMRSVLETSDFVADNPQYIDIVLEKCTSSLDKNYVTPAYKKLGREAAEKSAEVDTVFRELFGAGSAYIKKLFFDAHDPLPAPDESAGDMNTYAFWKKMVEKYGQGAVIEV